MPETHRVLIVDDDPRIVLTLADILTLSGYSVVTANGGADGLTRFDNDFMCVLSDVLMPGMNGIEFQKEVIKKIGNVPFLFMTAYADNEFYTMAIQQGALAVLEKPLKLDLLLKSLKEISLSPHKSNNQNLSRLI